MSEWQPIETAPVGETVLVFRPHAKMMGGKICFGLYQQYMGEDKPKWSIDGSRDKAKFSAPTHWMSLPDLPNRRPRPHPARWITNGLVPTSLLSSMGDLNRPVPAQPVVDAKQADVLHRAHLASVEEVKQPDRAADLSIKILPGNRISRADAAKLFGRQAKTMAEWSYRGWGPRCIDVGGRVFHDYDECIEMARGERPVKP